jgi:hypothetical protein
MKNSFTPFPISTRRSVLEDDEAPLCVCVVPHAAHFSLVLVVVGTNTNTNTNTTIREAEEEKCDNGTLFSSPRLIGKSLVNAKRQPGESGGSMRADGAGPCSGKPRYEGAEELHWVPEAHR